MKLTNETGNVIKRTNSKRKVEQLLSLGYRILIEEPITQDTTSKKENTTKNENKPKSALNKNITTRKKGAASEKNKT